MFGRRELLVSHWNNQDVVFIAASLPFVILCTWGDRGKTKNLDVSRRAQSFGWPIESSGSLFSGPNRSSFDHVVWSSRLKETGAVDVVTWSRFKDSKEISARCKHVGTLCTCSSWIVSTPLTTSATAGCESIIQWCHARMVSQRTSSHIKVAVRWWTRRVQNGLY